MAPGVSRARHADSSAPSLMNPSQPHRDELTGVLDLVRDQAEDYLKALDARPVRSTTAEATAAALEGPFPETGEGAGAALRELLDRGLDAAVHSSGPRFFHFVIGGVTPAALGADWLASLLDQCAGMWVASPLGTRLENVSIAWLKDLFGLPAEWGGAITSGATMANFSGLAAARQWWGERHGVDVSHRGLAGLPAPPVFSSGYVHASSVKALGMLGIGRDSVRRFARDAAGRLDLDALEAALGELGGAPAVLIGNAGEVNAGDFDPLEALADLAERHGAWLHVDGAFGLFARTTPRTEALARGVERAHSITVDGHKWLNVPYDCGFTFVRDTTYLKKAYAVTAAYLDEADEGRPVMSDFVPESSRRARSLCVWSTLRAYGRHGVRSMVERHLDLAQHLAARVDAEPDLERLAEVPLNIVCFRWRPEGCSEEALDELNTRLGAAVIEDGRVFLGTTLYEGRVALRPAIVNWRTETSDVDFLVDVLLELGRSIRG